MQTSTHNSSQVRGGAGAPAFSSLADETRSAVDTACAAFHLSRATQTLRIWACKENGPLRPIRINGRLAWPVADLRRLLGVAQ
jgi:hypothetical protein